MHPYIETSIHTRVNSFRHTYTHITKHIQITVYSYIHIYIHICQYTYVMVSVARGCSKIDHPSAVKWMERPRASTGVYPHKQ